MMSWVCAEQVLNRVGVAKTRLQPEADDISLYMWLRHVWTPFSFSHIFLEEWAMLSYCIEVVACNIHNDSLMYFAAAFR